MKFFRSAALLITCTAALILSGGCGKKEEGKVKIGVSIPSADHGWTGGVVWWAEQTKKEIEAKDPNIQIILSTAKDSAEQVNKIENMMIQGIKALVILPQQPAPLTGVCEQVKKAGIYLVVVDRGLSQEVQDLIIAGDNAGFGRTCAEEMAKRLNGKGSIVVMEGIPCEVNTMRVNAFKEVMKKHPGIKILDSQSAYWSTEKGLKLMENYLQKFPKIDAVWTGDDDVLTGALKAYEESKRKDIRFFIGGAGSKTIVKKVLDKDPLIPFNVTYPPRMIAYGIEHAVAAAKGHPKTQEKRVTVPADVITPKNAKFFYYPNSIY